ncbi:MAG TPA: hypothetical protein VIR34_16790 [Gemmatimonadaceae bacterium]
MASSPTSARPLLLDDRDPNALTRIEASEVPSARARTVDDAVRPSSHVVKSIQY